MLLVALALKVQMEYRVSEVLQVIKEQSVHKVFKVVLEVTRD